MATRVAKRRPDEGKYDEQIDKMNNDKSTPQYRDADIDQASATDSHRQDDSSELKRGQGNGKAVSSFPYIYHRNTGSCPNKTGVFFDSKKGDIGQYWAFTRDHNGVWKRQYIPSDDVKSLKNINASRGAPPHIDHPAFLDCRLNVDGFRKEISKGHSRLNPVEYTDEDEINAMFVDRCRKLSQLSDETLMAIGQSGLENNSGDYRDCLDPQELVNEIKDAISNFRHVDVGDHHLSGRDHSHSNVDHDDKDHEDDGHTSRKHPPCTSSEKSRATIAPDDICIYTSMDDDDDDDDQGSTNDNHHHPSSSRDDSKPSREASDECDINPRRKDGEIDESAYVIRHTRPPHDDTKDHHSQDDDLSPEDQSQDIPTQEVSAHEPEKEKDIGTPAEDYINSIHKKYPQDYRTVGPKRLAKSILHSIRKLKHRKGSRYCLSPTHNGLQDGMVRHGQVVRRGSVTGDDGNQTPLEQFNGKSVTRLARELFMNAIRSNVSDYRLDGGAILSKLLSNATNKLKHVLPHQSNLESWAVDAISHAAKRYLAEQLSGNSDDHTNEQDPSEEVNHELDTLFSSINTKSSDDKMKHLLNKIGANQSLISTLLDKAVSAISGSQNGESQPVSDMMKWARQLSTSSDPSLPRFAPQELLSDFTRMIGLTSSSR